MQTYLFIQYIYLLQLQKLEAVNNFQLTVIDTIIILPSYIKIILQQKHGK